MSQETLAMRIDVSIPHMSNIENGKTKFSLQVLLSLAEALNVTPDALLPFIVIYYPHSRPLLSRNHIILFLRLLPPKKL